MEPCPRVLLGGTLIDGTGRPPVKDSIVLIKGDYIIAAGKKEGIEIPQGSKIYNVSGMTVLPGLIDSHCHFIEMGIDMIRKEDLRYTSSLAEALGLIKKKVESTPKGEWILGKGWDESKWPENRYITKKDLDGFSPDNPIMLTRVCEHMASINSRALTIAKITRDTPSPPGGLIDKDEDGEPTGILRDCIRLIEAHIAPITEEMAVDGLKMASEHALSLGCTSVHDADLNAFQLKAYQSALEKGVLNVRAYLMLNKEIQEHSYKLGIRTSFGNDMIKIGSMKHLMDGSLGARTAALFEPYADEPSTNGLLLVPPAELLEKAKEAHLNGSQLAIHAIGDLAIENVINIYQEVLKASPRKDHRHRIEHCEVMTAGQIERIGELGIIPAMQPNYVGEWAGPGSMYEQRLGPERNRLNNPYRSLLDEGITVCFGSDGMPFNPIYGLWSAINHGIKENRVGLIEAVKCYTLNGAYASFEEDIKGSIEPGKLADIAVIDRDLTEIPPKEIKDAKVYMTMLNGKILYYKER